MAQRFDRVDAPEWMTEKFTTTDEGFLIGRAVITNIGIFPYLMADGSVEYELRHPDDVFTSDSMQSLKMKPLTNDHPSEILTPENVKDYQVGNVGDNPFNGDNIHLTIDMIIQDKQAIADVLSGKRELSCGYSADVVDESGTWMGTRYTKRQKNIRYNHVALVDKGRAGEAARVRLDSGDGAMVNIVNDMAILVANNNGGKQMAENMKKVKLDGVDYEAEAPVISALTNSQKTLDSVNVSLKEANGKLSAIEAERDSLKETVAKLKADSLDESAISARVDEKLRIFSYAKEANVEIADGASDMDIKKQVILSQFSTAKLDGRDEVYINSRFDCAVEEIDAAREAGADATVRVAGHKDAGAVDAVADAKKRYMDRLTSVSK